MEEMNKEVLLESLAHEQQQAEEISTLPYPERAYTAFQHARGALWSIANASMDLEIKVAINKLVETLDDAFTKNVG